MKRLVLPTLTVFALVFAGNALASSVGWKPVAVAAKLKATWTTADPKATAEIQEHIDALIKAGGSPNDPLILALRDDLKTANHAAKVTSASCAGVGKPSRGRFSRFHCTVKVAAGERTPPDNQFYTASLKVTVTTSRGFVVRVGWR